MSIRDEVQAVIDGILKGDILGTFDRFYAEDVVMSEHGAGERTTQNQVAVQTWKDGRVVREVFYHG